MEKVPIRAIREYCIECSGGSKNEVKLCPAENCPLYAFRFGKNPYRKKREISEDHMKKMMDGLAKHRQEDKD